MSAARAASPSRARLVSSDGPQSCPLWLQRAEVAFCHGGHGTVMECILHRTPMALFPQNIEQLEIARRIEALGLGGLVRQPADQIRGEQLGALIERLRTDVRMKGELARYSALLRAQSGSRQAVSLVLARLDAGARVNGAAGA